jgi:small subunit ribosomal protein S18
LSEERTNETRTYNEERPQRDDRDSRGSRGGRGGRGGYRRGGRFNRRPRSFYTEALSKVDKLTYKEVDTLKLFTTERGKIRPRRQTGVSAKQQREITQAIKRARHMALLPFVNDSAHE